MGKSDHEGLPQERRASYATNFLQRLSTKDWRKKITTVMEKRLRMKPLGKLFVEAMLSWKSDLGAFGREHGNLQKLLPVESTTSSVDRVRREKDRSHRGPCPLRPGDQHHHQSPLQRPSNGSFSVCVPMSRWLKSSTGRLQQGSGWTMWTSGCGRGRFILHREFDALVRAVGWDAATYLPYCLRLRRRRATFFYQQMQSLARTANPIRKIQPLRGSRSMTPVLRWLLSLRQVTLSLDS